MRKIKFILYLFAIVSCTSNNSSSKNVESNKNKNLNKIYVFENDTLKQSIEIRFNNENEIEFKLISQNKQKQQKSEIKGVAIIKSGDVELDEDEDGNAYPVTEYIYSKDCWLSIRLDIDTKTKISIKDADCNIYNLNCPYNSVDILIKQ